MRHLVNFSKVADATLFSDYLIAHGVENEIIQEENNISGIWIYSEEQGPIARELLEKFLQNPSDNQFKEASGSYARLLKQKQQEEAQARARMVDIRTTWNRYTTNKMGPITLALMAFSILVGIVSFLGSRSDTVSFLYITDVTLKEGYLAYHTNLPEFFHGQIWRIFTPIFLHFGFLHILFNMLWLRDLGSLLENKHGSFTYLMMVLVIAGLSNIAQYLIKGPMFGGMSGVVYGFLGFLWIRGKYDPRYGTHINRETVIMMIAWFFLGLFNIIPGMANVVHGVGLLVGMVWGYGSARFSRS